MEPVEARPIWSMSGKEMLDALDAAHDELTRLQTYRHELLAAFDAAGHARDFGAKDTVELVSFRHRLPATQVRADLKFAAALPKYKAVSAALPSLLSEDPDPDEDGYLLHFSQAKAIVTALEKIPTSAMVPVEDLEAAEQQLVKAAQHLNPADLARAGKQVRDILDTDGPEPAEEDAYRREALWYRKADQGIRIGGYLANENAELFTTLIHAGAKPHKTTDGQPDPRGRDKRQADALVAILNAATSGSGDAGPNITITIDYNALKNATAKATHANATDPASRTDRAGADTDGEGCTPVAPNTSPDANNPAREEHPSSPTEPPPPPNSATSAQPSPFGPGSAQAVPSGLDATQSPPSTASSAESLPLSLGGGQPLPFSLGAGSGMGELVFGDNLSAAAVRRLACDSGVLPVVLDSNSQPLDVGMKKRFVTEPIRNALIARDRGCLICGAPPIMCDAHHVVHWIDGGPTSLANLGLLCKLHHREIHHGHWSVSITDGIPQISRPPWADRTPRRRRRLRLPPNRPPETPPGWPLTPAETTPNGRPLGPAETPHGRPQTPAKTSTRTWPHTDDVPWITAEDAIRLDPWGDQPAPVCQPPLAS